MIFLKTAQEIELMRSAAKAAFEVHLALSQLVQPGISTRDLERKALEIMDRLGVRSSYKGYQLRNGATPFPAAAYIDINNSVVHSIPSDRKLKAGDIVKIGVGIVKDDFHADKTVTYGVGQISDQAARLIATANEAMWRAISECRPGNHLSNISHSIQTTVESAGYSVVREFVGHGIGRRHHEDPPVPNFGLPDKGVRLRTGMVIKPHVLLNVGGAEVALRADGWEAVTRDGSLSACATETIAVADDGPDVLTGLIGSSGASSIRPTAYELGRNLGDADLLVGDLILGEYIEKIISGGMGTVYLTHSHAFKTLSAQVFEETEWRFFVKEIETWLRLPAHKNIVKAYTVAPERGRVFLVLERIRGYDLREPIRSGEYTLSQALTWARQICEGMAFIHDARGLVHRDLKPANILIDDAGVARITDFGIASLLRDSGKLMTGAGGFDASSLMHTGAGIGTPAYMPPEQWAAFGEVDVRSDVYSFGMLLYELLCRRHPFEEALGSEHELTYKHLNEKPPDPREYNPAIPGDVASIVFKCIEKDPARRYQTFAHLAGDLVKAAEGLARDRYVGDKYAASPSHVQRAVGQPREAGDASASGSSGPPVQERLVRAESSDERGVGESPNSRVQRTVVREGTAGVRGEGPSNWMKRLMGKLRRGL